MRAQDPVGMGPAVCGALHHAGFAKRNVLHALVCMLYFGTLGHGVVWCIFDCLSDTAAAVSRCCESAVSIVNHQIIVS